MPTSSKYGKLYTALMINKLKDLLPIESILDVGVGEGTYSDILSPYLENTTWSGIEVWKPYITEYNLGNKYQILINQDVRQINFAEGPSYDIALFGDILEHMTKEEAQTLIKKVIPKTHLIMISIPIVHFPQDIVGGNPFEQHIKDNWSHEEVLESFPNIISAFIHNFIGVYFLSTNPEFSTIIRKLQSQISKLVKQNLTNETIFWA